MSYLLLEHSHLEFVEMKNILSKDTYVKEKLIKLQRGYKNEINTGYSFSEMIDASNYRMYVVHKTHERVLF